MLLKMSSSNTLDLQCQETILSLDAMEYIEYPPMIGECYWDKFSSLKGALEVSS